MMIIMMHWTETTKAATSGKNRNTNYDDNNDEDEREKRERGREAKAPLRLKVEQIETKVRHGKRGNKGPRGEKKRGAKRTNEGPERFRVVGQSRRRDHYGGVVRTLGANISYFVPTNRDIAAIWVCISAAPIVRRVFAKYHNSLLSMKEKILLYSDEGKKEVTSH